MMTKTWWRKPPIEHSNKGDLNPPTSMGLFLGCNISLPGDKIERYEIAVFCIVTRLSLSFTVEIGIHIELDLLA